MPRWIVCVCVFNFILCDFHPENIESKQNGKIRFIKSPAVKRVAQLRTRDDVATFLYTCKSNTFHLHSASKKKKKEKYSCHHLFLLSFIHHSFVCSWLIFKKSFFWRNLHKIIDSPAVRKNKVLQELYDVELTWLARALRCVDGSSPEAATAKVADVPISDTPPPSPLT